MSEKVAACAVVVKIRSVISGVMIFLRLRMRVLVKV